MAYIGTDGDDTNVAGAESEKYGAGGSDELSSYAASYNYLEGGSGNDLLYLGTNFATSYLIGHGGDGADIIIGHASNDFLYGGAGSDILLGGKPADGTLLTGGTAPHPVFRSGNDYLDGGEGIDAIYGFDGNDVIYGGEGDDGGPLLLTQFRVTTYKAFAGLYGGAGDDFIDGGRGDDELSGNEGDDTLIGGVGNDTLFGGLGADLMDGGLGNDIFFVDSDDTIVDSGGNDTFSPSGSGSIMNLLFIENLLLSLDGNTTGSGNSGNNRVTGNEGNNTLNGREGNDTVDGTDGIDRLIGGLGRDTLIGGGGNDSFVYKSVQESRPGNRDRVLDFDDDGNDRIDLSAIYSGKLKFVTGGFTAIGQVHVTKSGADVMVEANTTGSLAMDFAIRLDDTRLVSIRAAEDFVL